MNYEMLLLEVQALEFIDGREEAEGAVVAALSTLMSRLTEEDARRLAAELPQPLDYDALRGGQRLPRQTSVADYFLELAEDFEIEPHQARELAWTIIHAVKDGLGGETVRQMQEHLDPDWAWLVRSS